MYVLVTSGLATAPSPTTSSPTSRGRLIRKSLRLMWRPLQTSKQAPPPPNGSHPRG
nr:MAG TPA: hypothetical protein [Caudoviricetes sp.]